MHTSLHSTQCIGYDLDSYYTNLSTESHTAPDYMREDLAYACSALQRHQVLVAVVLSLREQEADVQNFWFDGYTLWWLQGFLRSWEANGLKLRVVSRVNQVVSDLAHSSCMNCKVRVFVTGANGPLSIAKCSLELQSFFLKRNSM